MANLTEEQLKQNIISLTEQNAEPEDITSYISEQGFDPKNYIEINSEAKPKEEKSFFKDMSTIAEKAMPIAAAAISPVKKFPQTEKSKEALQEIAQKVSPTAKVVLPITAAFLAPSSIIPQAIAAGSAGTIAGMIESFGKEGKIKVGTMKKEAIKEAGTSIAVDLALGAVGKSIKITGGILKKIAKPAIESKIAQETIESMTKFGKKAENYFKERTAKFTDILAKKNEVSINEISKGIELIDKDIKLSKVKLEKSLSNPIRQMKKTLKKQYKEIMSINGMNPVDIENEINAASDILGLETKGLRSGKAKIKRILKGFDNDVIKESENITGALPENLLNLRAKEHGIDIVNQVTFQDAHILKQHLNTLRYKIATSSDSVQKNLIPQLDEVLNSLNSKLDAVSGEIYKKTNRLYSTLLSTEEFLNRKLGKVSYAAGLSGYRENIKTGIDNLLKKGETLGPEVFDSSNSYIIALKSQIDLLKDSGIDRMSKYGQALEKRMLSVVDLAFSKKSMDDTIKKLKNSDPKDFDLIRLTNRLNRDVADKIESEISQNRLKIRDKKVDYGVLSLSIAGSAFSFFLPKELGLPVFALTNLAILRKYSPTAAALTLEFADDILKYVDKIPMKENLKNSTRIFAKRLIAENTETENL